MYSVDLSSIPVGNPIYDRVAIEIGKGLVVNGYAIKGVDGEPNTDGCLGVPGLAECLGFTPQGLRYLLNNLDSLAYKELIAYGFSGEVRTIRARVGRIVKPVTAISFSDFDAFLAYASLTANKPRANGIALAFAEIGLKAMGSIKQTKEEMAALIDLRVCEALDEAKYDDF